MPENLEKFNKFVKSLNKYTEFYVKRKRESFLMRIFKYILFFVPGFYTDYITAIGKTIYFPDNSELGSHESLVGVAHEFQHIMDNKNHRFYYSLSYLFPQILSLLSIFAIFSPWSFLFLIFLLPIPAPFRKYYEVRGYKASIYTFYLFLLKENYNLKDIKELLNSYALYCSEKFFTGPAYYFMWPFGVDKELLGFINDIFSGKELGSFYRIIDEAFESIDI